MSKIEKHGAIFTHTDNTEEDEKAAAKMQRTVEFLRELRAQLKAANLNATDKDGAFIMPDFTLPVLVELFNAYQDVSEYLVPELKKIVQQTADKVRK